MSRDKLPKEPFSQELRNCMADVEALLRKYDAMGLVVLQSKQHVEFKLCVTEPTWSIFEWLPAGDGKSHLNMKFRKANHENGEFCTGAIWSFRRVAKMFNLFFDQIANKIESKMEVDNTMGDITNEGRS